MKTWKYIPWEQCGICGDSVEAFTDCPDEDVYDSDPARCMACGAISSFSVDGETGHAWIQEWEEKK